MKTLKNELKDKNLYDIDIRQAITERLASYKDCKVMQEVYTSSGTVIADVVAVNGHICAYEIKSDKDSLLRLPNQVEFYDKNFEMNSIIVGEKFEKKINDKIPSHWGIIVAYRGKTKVNLKFIRRPKMNPYVNFGDFLHHLSSDELKQMVLNFNLFPDRSRSEIRRIFKQELINLIEKNSNKAEKELVRKEVRNILKQKRLGQKNL